MAIRKTPEGYVLASILEYLAVKKIFALRMNSGAIQDKRGIPVRMHKPGTADILAFNRDGELFLPLWIECKAPNGKQSELQKEFEAKVKAEGHAYVVAYGVEDVERVL